VYLISVCAERTIMRLFNGWAKWRLADLNYLLLSMYEFCGRFRNKTQILRNKFQLRHTHL